MLKITTVDTIIRDPAAEAEINTIRDTGECEEGCVSAVIIQKE